MRQNSFWHRCWHDCHPRSEWNTRLFPGTVVRKLRHRSESWFESGFTSCSWEGSLVFSGFMFNCWSDSWVLGWG